MQEEKQDVLKLNEPVIIKLQARVRGAAARRYVQLRREVFTYFSTLLQQRIRGRIQMRKDIAYRNAALVAVVRIQVGRFVCV